MIQKKEAEFGEHPNVIFYMAVAPQLVPDIAKKLGKCKYLPGQGIYPHRDRKTIWS